MNLTLEPHRLDFPFTSADSPKLRALIAADLQRIVLEVAAVDRHARAIVLTGGFSRGEGSAIQDRPLNDYDLVVVRQRPTPSGRTYRAVVARLERELGLHVDLLPVWRQRLRWVAPKLFWFDAKFGGRVIAGDATVLARIPVASAEEIPASEAARLLCNRAVGLLEAVPGPGHRPDRLRVQLQCAKALLASMDAALLLAGEYAPRMRERAARFTRRGLASSARARRLVDWAVAWKLDPASHGRDDLPSLWSGARDCLLDAVAAAFPATGWGKVETYPQDAPVDWTEWLAHLAMTRGRDRGMKPSHALRAEGLTLLRAARYPVGVPPAWRATLEDLLARRALTLQ